MELKMWVSDATKNDIVHKTDVAKWGLYTSEFTFKASNTASISRVKISLVDPSGVAVNKKDGTPFVRIPDDDGLPTFIKAPTESDTYGMDKVAGDGIFTTGVTGELVEMSKWCSFPEGQYQLKVDITVNDSSLKDVTASYPIYIAKNCE
jgi:hypothetical protein